MPDLETTRRIARVLGVPVRDMLIRSGRLTAEELAVPRSDTTSVLTVTDTTSRPTLEEVADLMGVPADRREMFVRVVEQFLPAESRDQDARRPDASGGRLEEAVVTASGRGRGGRRGDSAPGAREASTANEAALLSGRLRTPLPLAQAPTEPWSAFSLRPVGPHVIQVLAPPTLSCACARPVSQLVQRQSCARRVGQQRSRRPAGL